MSESRVALVTGASSGFGKITASMLSRRGFQVFGTSRNPESGKPDGFDMLQLDVDSDDSVRSCVEALIQRTGRVDALVNSAGYVFTGGVEESSIDEAKAQFETNFFGTVRMVKAVLPSMRIRRTGHIVNIGSIAGSFPVPFEGFYAATKAALAAYSEALRHEVKSFNIKVSIVEPGFFKTNIENAKKMAAKSIEDYSQMERRALSRLAEHIENGADPTQVAETIVRIVENDSPRLRYRVGKEARYFALKAMMPASSFESQVRKHWRLES